MVGTSERYGSAAEHVERFTMVDAKGRILLVIQFLFFSKPNKTYGSTPRKYRNMNRAR